MTGRERERERQGERVGTRIGKERERVQCVSPEEKHAVNIQVSSKLLLASTIKQVYYCTEPHSKEKKIHPI